MWLNACEPTDEEIEAVYHRLKEYEDLEDRLNKVYDCDGLLLKVVETIEKHPKLLTDEEVDKWEEYKRLEEQGRLVKSPCKVGDTVYAIGFSNNKPIIYESIVLSILITEEGIVFNVKVDEFGINSQLKQSMFDKTVFLTQPEAEAKLKELRGESIEDD